MKIQDQLDQWVDGNPIHNDERDECCPDFSCCNGNIVDKDVRERFVRAYREGDGETQDQMLMMFLGNAFSDKDIYVAGGEIPENIH
jgi:hypothetical protein